MQPQDFSRYLRRTVLVPVVLLAVLAGVLLWQITYMAQSLGELDRSERVIADGHLLLQQGLNMETGLRGYLITGDERFLEPYTQALKGEELVVKELQGLVRDNPAQYEALQQVQQRIEDWKLYAQRMIAIRKTGPEYANPELNLDGKRRMDAIRAGTETLLSDAERMRDERSKNAQRATRSALIMLAVLTAAVALIVVAVTRFRMMEISAAYIRHLDAERHQTEEARSNREWLLTTLRSIGEGVIATNPQGRIDFLNAAGEELTGWKRQDARGRPVTDVLKMFDEKTGEPIKDPAEFVRTRRGHGSQNAISVLERRDGERRVIDESAAPIVDSNGNLQGLVLVFRDMTERRRAESVLRSSERLALVGRLSATIAHEIQNPLDAVTNILYLLKTASGMSQPAIEYTQMAQDEVSRITQITRQLLSFNREAREPVAVDLGEIVDSVLGLFGPKLTSNGIRVQKAYETREKVLGLPGELRQVFSNLVGNAMEASAKGGEINVRIAATMDWRDPGRRGVRVVVSDNGSGIPKSARSGLFTPFFTTKGEKGTGLGLWVSKGIVEKHEGSLRFRSATNGNRRGTTFTVFLPFEPTARAHAGNAA